MGNKHGEVSHAKAFCLCDCHGVCRRCRLKADAEEDDLSVRILTCELQCVQGRVYDAYIAAFALDAEQILLTADTIVWHRGKDMGKPADRREAISILGALSGNTHQVSTGVCLRSDTARKSFFAVTDVTFSRLEQEEIESYVTNYLPYDKAGAYGIQEWIGTIAVERIVGSYFNVMGLPVQRVYGELKSITGNPVK